MGMQRRSITEIVPDGVGALIVFDEVCVLCNGFARFITRIDTKSRCRFTSAQGPIGQTLYSVLGYSRDEFETNLVIINGEVFTKMYALIAVMDLIGGPWRVVGALRILPKPIASWLYDAIAKNRYRIFGKFAACPVPTPEMKKRLI